MNISDEHVPMIVRALEHYADFFKATNRDDRLSRDLAESFEKKPAAKQEPERMVKRDETALKTLLLVGYQDTDDQKRTNSHADANQDLPPDVSRFHSSDGLHRVYFFKAESLHVQLAMVFAVESKAGFRNIADPATRFRATVKS